MLDWDDFRFLLAVRNARSLAGAARQLGVDKATVSRRVAAAESALGVRVFDRKPDGFELTPHGERVFAAITEVDQTFATLVADLSESAGDATGVVYVTVPQFFASTVLFASLPAFRAAHPRIELVINASSSVLNMAQREAEVGLRNVKPDQMSVTLKRAGVLGSAMYASEDYLAKRGTPRSVDDVARHEVVGWDRALTFVPAFAWLAESGARCGLRVNDAAVLCDAVAAGLGLAVLPCVLGEERSGLVRLDALGRGREEIYIVAPGELRRSVRARAVVDLISKAWTANAQRLAGPA